MTLHAGVGFAIGMFPFICRAGFRLLALVMRSAIGTGPFTISKFALRCGYAQFALSEVTAGCAAQSEPVAQTQLLPSVDRRIVVEYGKPNKFADGLGAVLQYPHSVIKRTEGGKKYFNRDVSANSAADYLEHNDLADVRIVVHRHEPADQWRRLRENSAVSPWSRYSVGTLGWIRYNLFPPRVWGVDYYSPYTNTLHLNSDHIARSTYEAAMVKPFHETSFPAARSLAASLPPFNLIHHRRCTADMIAYTRERSDWEMEKSVYQQIYPAVGADTATLAYLYPSIWVIPFARLGGAMVGGVAGSAALKRREAELVAAGNPVPPDGHAELATYHEPVESAPLPSATAPIPQALPPASPPSEPLPVLTQQ